MRPSGPRMLVTSMGTGGGWLGMRGTRKRDGLNRSIGLILVQDQSAIQENGIGVHAEVVGFVMFGDDDSEPFGLWQVIQETFVLDPLDGLARGAEQAEKNWVDGCVLVFGSF